MVSASLVAATTAAPALWSLGRSRRLVNRKLMKPITNAPTIEIVAETAIVRVPEATSQTSSTSGRIR